MRQQVAKMVDAVQSSRRAIPEPSESYVLGDLTVDYVGRWESLACRPAYLHRVPRRLSDDGWGAEETEDSIQKHAQETQQ